METRDRAVIEAIATYDAAHARMVSEARKAEQSRRPIAASIYRHKASMVARAALAEELDPEPRR